MATYIKKYNVYSRTWSVSALATSDLLEIIQALGFNPSTSLIEVNQNIPVSTGSDRDIALMHLQDITINGLWLDDIRYVVDSTTASLARKATLIYMDECVKAAVGRYIMCGLHEGLLRSKMIAVNKLFVYKGLNLTVSRSFSKVFGRRLDIRRVCIYDDCEKEFTFAAKVVRDGACVEETRTIKLKVTDGQILIRKELIEDVTNAFILRAPWTKGLAVATDFAWFDDHGVYAVTDHFGRRVAISDVDALIPMSAFKMGSCYDSWDQYAEAFDADGHEVRVALMQHYPKYASLSYQVLQTLIGADASDLKALSKETVDILNGYSNPAQAAKLPGGDLARACRLYPELMSEPYTKVTIETAYRRRRGEARGGRVFKAGQFRFLATDPVAIMEHIAGMEPTGMIGAHQVIANGLKLGDASVVRYPHLNVNFANVEVVHNPNFRYYTGYTIYVSIHDLIALLLRADYDGDKGFIMQDPLMLKLIRKSQALWNEPYVDWDAPGAKKTMYTKRAEYEYATALTGTAKVGVHSNNATRAWARIWDKIQAGDEIPESAKDAIAWLEMAANIDIDAAKNAGADLQEPMSVYQWHGRTVANGERIQRGENDLLPSALFYARNEDAQYLNELDYLRKTLDAHQLYLSGVTGGSDPMGDFEFKQIEGMQYWDNSQLRHLCIAVINGNMKIIRHPDAPNYQSDSGLINCWSKIIDVGTAKQLHIDREAEWCFTPSMLMFQSAQLRRIPGLSFRGSFDVETETWINQGVWQQHAFAHKEELLALHESDASPAVFADYRAYRRDVTIQAIREHAEAHGFTLEDAYNLIVAQTFAQTQKAQNSAKAYYDTLKRAFWDIFGEMAVEAIKLNIGDHADADDEEDVAFDIHEDLEVIDE